MKVLFATALSLALCAGVGGAVARAQSAPDFGSPPSGKIPLLFNDRHVYAKPDKVTSGRLLVAIVRDREILVPLRSLFQQMGATVSYDRIGRTATVQSANVKASLTVGDPKIVINGVASPLNVPPEIYEGQVVVPIRVLVEALGGYVAYLPNLHAVTVRYVPVTQAPVPPPPAAEPTFVPAVPAPTAPAVRATVGPGAPIPVGTPEPETYIVADAIVGPKIANAAAPNVTGASGTSFDVRGAAEFTIVDVNFDIGAGYEEYRYAHPNGPVTQPGGGPQAFEPAFVAIDRDYDAHLGIQLSPQKYYLAVGYAVDHIAGYPRIGGIGVGLEKLPNLDRHLDYAFDAFYYPNMSGHCGACAGAGSELAFKRLIYQIGLTYSFRPLFIEAGYSGDKGYSKGATSDDFTHSGIRAGLGLRF